ncbi:MAG: hypothetical protein RLZZ176_3182 [Cyanobacteriota bacterium]|jgi:hypothetical protein
MSNVDDTVGKGLEMLNPDKLILGKNTLNINLVMEKLRLYVFVIKNLIINYLLMYTGWDKTGRVHVVVFHL